MGFNHHSAALLPYTEREQLFLLEQKDNTYPVPHFRNRFTFIGGNWVKGKHAEASPREVLVREIKEEFWLEIEPEETLTSILQTELDETISAKTLDRAIIAMAREGGQRLLSNIRYHSTYAVRVRPPVLSQGKTYSNTIFVAMLSPDDVVFFQELLRLSNGMPTTDGAKFGTRLHLTQPNGTFAWGYDKILNQITGTTVTVDSLVAVEQLVHERQYDSTKGPTFVDIELIDYKGLN